jgi:hypothetical protein
MGSQDITHNPSFYFSIGAQVLGTLVLLGLVIVGIVFAQDRTDLVGEKLKTPQVEAPVTISINGKPAVRQVVRGEVDHLRITYRITDFEGQNDFYRVFCWSLESKAAGFAGDFDKIAESFREEKVISNQFRSVNVRTPTRATGLLRLLDSNPRLQHRLLIY